MPSAFLNAGADYIPAGGRESHRDSDTARAGEERKAVSVSAGQQQKQRFFKSQ